MIMSWVGGEIDYWRNRAREQSVGRDVACGEALRGMNFFVRSGKCITHITTYLVNFSGVAFS